MSGQRPEVIVVGGGFGGLYAARALKGRAGARHARRPAEPPPLPAVALPGGHRRPEPRRHRGADPRVLRRSEERRRSCSAEAVAVDATARKVVLADGELSYDYLILATGATHSYFGHDEWDAPRARAQEHRGRAGDPPPRAPRVRDGRARAGCRAPPRVADLRDRRRRARRASSWPARWPRSRARRWHATSGTSTRPRAHHPDRRRRRACSRPTRSISRPRPARSSSGSGVEVRTGARVTGIDAGGVTLGDERILTRTVLWAAGVAASPLARTLGVPLDRAGRVLVEPDLAIPGHDDVFVVGDLAALEQDGKPVPGVAPAAIQGAARRAEHPSRARRPAAAAVPLPGQGQLATIGRGKAVGELAGGLKLSGFLAWLAWLFDPHLLPDRIPQPRAGDLPVGLVVPDLPARRAPDHRTASAPAPVASTPSPAVGRRAGAVG